ncbi:uncharacterized protein LOC124281571 [Haliotis rubra]|uniref:uncharacterized protein LOC124281571 n=1 Tax=Haliotis rubra TaxID=36100 RepID=UPI001EE50864|nr:uncharacterized protein LOC124281571 [Haliotis rubra]
MLLSLVIFALCVAVGAADVTCPHLPCPFVGFCKQTVPTYYDHDGVRCRGCDQCAMDPQDVPSGTPLPFVHAIQLHMCPMYMCMNPGQCSVPYTYSHFMVNGLNCTGCPSCPTGGHPDGSIILKKKQLLQGGVFQLDQCPMVLCKQPAPCDVAYKISTMHVSGKDCPGCPYCPTDKAA